MKTIAILGAKGRLSHITAKAFFEAGYTVIAVTRTGFVDGLPTGILHRKADALNKQALIEATKGVDFIFNGLNPIYTKWREVAVPMAKNTLAAAKENNAIHLFPGNIYNYGKDVTLSMPADVNWPPARGKSAIRIEMEALFEQAAQKDSVKTIILRSGDFYGGPIGGSWFDLILTSKLKKNIFTYPGPMDIPHAWAYLPDLAQAFVKLAENEAHFSNFERFNFAGHVMTGTEMHTLISQSVERTVKRVGFPWIVLRAGGLFNNMWREISEMSYLWFTAHSLDGSKLVDAIGPTFQTDPLIAITQSLHELDLSQKNIKHA